mmetsp:Transcript_7404/g.15141  ORF Transcript_7404/g.15141 Transcript_7404/m.15141 type:complete len:231 (+) Transcript_7404:470-1162(+)
MVANSFSILEIGSLLLLIVNVDEEVAVKQSTPCESSNAVHEVSAQSTTFEMPSFVNNAASSPSTDVADGSTIDIVTPFFSQYRQHSNIISFTCLQAAVAVACDEEDVEIEDVIVASVGSRNSASRILSIKFTSSPPPSLCALHFIPPLISSLTLLQLGSNTLVKEAINISYSAAATSPCFQHALANRRRYLSPISTGDVDCCSLFAAGFLSPSVECSTGRKSARLMGTHL